MNIIPSKKLYLPAISIIAVVFMLLVIVTLSSYRNINRNKGAALESLERQGLAILRSVEAGARTGMMRHSWRRDALDHFLAEAGRDEDIAYIYLVNSDGMIVSHSDTSQKGGWIVPSAGLPSEREIIHQVVRENGGVKIYELIKRFTPFECMAPRGPVRLGDRGMRRRRPPENICENTIVVLGLKMDAYETARKADLQHAVIMAAILTILGSGAVFFIFFIQNFYLVERALKQTQDYTRQVLASMANGLLSVDSGGSIVSYNDAALKILGLDGNEIRKMQIEDLFDPDTSGIRETIENFEFIMDREILYRISPAEPVPLALSVTPITAPDTHQRGAVIVIRDLREIKRLEAAVRRSEKLALIGKLAAGVAHEIRNPLSSIRGFAQFLSHVLKDRPKDKEYADIMVKEIDRINRVVTDLLTFAGPMDRKTSKTSVQELIDHTLMLVRKDAEQRGIELNKTIPPGIPSIYIDANQITQALLNLLLNALYSVGDRGRIEIGAELMVGSIRFWVEDDGPGVSKDIQKQIFDPFFTTRQKGTGLGLAIVQKIAEGHGGSIELESPAPGKPKGCRFYLSVGLNQETNHQ